MVADFYVSYNLAEALKKIKFTWPCDRFYTREDTPDGEPWVTPTANTPHDYNSPRNGEPKFLKPLCSAPTIYKVHRWLREVMGVAINITAHDGGFYTWDVVYLSNYQDNGDNYIKIDLKSYRNYETALTFAIIKTIKFLNKNILD